MAKAGERMDKFETALEVQDHRWDERLNKLWESQSMMMDSQNRTWEAIGTMAKNVDSLTATVDRLVKGLHRPNGQSE